MWFEASKLRNEEQSDRAIYKMMMDKLVDPIGNYKSLAIGTMADIATLEEQNLTYDIMRQGLKFSTEVNPAAKIMGATYDEMFNFYGRLRDANNRTIDQLLGQAAAESPH